MTIKIQKMMRYLVLFLLVALPSAACIMSILPSLKLLHAAIVLKVPTSLSENSVQEATISDAKRKIQKHFLDNDVYIPLEDIVFLASKESPDNNMSSMTKAACGKNGLIAIWLPFEVRLPLLGSWIYEWCWDLKK